MKWQDKFIQSSNEVCVAEHNRKWTASAQSTVPKQGAEEKGPQQLVLLPWKCRHSQLWHLISYKQPDMILQGYTRSAWVWQLTQEGFSKSISTTHSAPVESEGKASLKDKNIPNKTNKQIKMHFITPKYPLPSFPDGVLSPCCATPIHQSKLPQLKTFARLLTVLSRTTWAGGFHLICWHLTWNSILEGKPIKKQRKKQILGPPLCFTRLSFASATSASLLKIPCFCNGLHSVISPWRREGAAHHGAHQPSLPSFPPPPQHFCPRAGRGHPAGPSWHRMLESSVVSSGGIWKK